MNPSRDPRSGPLAWLIIPVGGDHVPHSTTAQQLDRHAVHVWAAHLAGRPDSINRSWAVLDREERTRANRFRFEEHRTRFVLAHGFLREVLGRYLDRDAGTIAFDVDAYGKPHVAGGGLHFNLSHSGALAVVALSWSVRVGVDIEQIRPLPDLYALAHRFFVRSERDGLFASPANQRVDAFFSCWTRKEAFTKAVGKGLSIPLDSVDTSLDDGAPSRLICRPSDALGATSWWLSDLPPITGYAGALVVGGRSPRVACWQWAPEYMKTRIGS